VVEQGTHKPLVGSSTLPPGTFFAMPWVYILKGSPSRHYIGSAVDLDARFAQYLRGHTATTKRLGEKLEIVARKEVATLGEARKIESELKRKKNPQARQLPFAKLEQPRKLFGVGREFNSPPW
jgi:predicted GIY-YIG superfamily endonuclease